MSDLSAKRDRLLAILREMPRAVVAFSGGIDSTVVAQAAFLALGNRAVAVTSDSPSVPRAELALAIDLAKRIGMLHRVVQTEELPDRPTEDGGSVAEVRQGEDLYSIPTALLYTRGGKAFSTQTLESLKQSAAAH